MATKNYFLDVAGHIPGAKVNAATRAQAPAMAAKDPKDPTYNRTPPPTDYVAAENEYARQKDATWGGTNYGANRYGGPSSLTPGQAEKQRGIDAEIFDPTLEIVQTRSLAKDDTGDKPVDWQLRDIGAKNCGDGFGQESARSRQASTHSGSAVKVPAKVGQGADPLPTTDEYGSGVKS